MFYGGEISVDYIISSFRVDLSRESANPLTYTRTYTYMLNIHERDLRLSSDEITPDGLSVLIGMCTYRPNKLQMLSTISPEISPPSLMEPRLSISRVSRSCSTVGRESK